MTAVVSGLRVKVGMTHGDVRVASRGRLVLIGYVAGTLTVESGGYANLMGMMERLVVAPGARATLRGWCRGDVVNDGGDLQVMRGAVIGGALLGPRGDAGEPAGQIGEIRD